MSGWKQWQHIICALLRRTNLLCADITKLLFPDPRSTAWIRECGLRRKHVESSTLHTFYLDLDNASCVPVAVLDFSNRTFVTGDLKHKQYEKWDTINELYSRIKTRLCYFKIATGDKATLKSCKTANTWDRYAAAYTTCDAYWCCRGFFYLATLKTSLSEEQITCVALCECATAVWRIWPPHRNWQKLTSSSETMPYKGPHEVDSEANGKVLLLDMGPKFRVNAEFIQMSCVKTSPARLPKRVGFKWNTEISFLTDTIPLIARH